MFTKIRNRIIVSFLTLIATMVSSLLLIIVAHTREYHLGVIRREMAEKINSIELMIRQNPGRYLAAPPPERARMIREIARAIDLRITLVGPDGTVLSDSDVPRVDRMENHRYRAEIREALAGRIGTSIRHSATLGTDMLYTARRSEIGIIRLAKPLREVDESIGRLRKYILTAGLILLALSSVVVVVLSRRITRPINETMRFARDFSNGDLSRRIPNYRNDEIGTLQKALNRLADTVLEKINTLDFERHKLENTIESISDGIAVIGRDKRMLVANAAFKSLLDIDTTVVGKLFFEAIRNRSLNSRIEEALATGRPAAFDERFLSGRHCDVSIRPITGARALEGLLVVLHDITDRKKTEQMKTDLVGNMSHELKTPVAILKGYLETMEQHLDDPATACELLRKALANVDRQAALINDILKLNRLETTRDFPAEQMPITEILRNCIEILGPQAQKKNVTIEFNPGGLAASRRGNRLLAEEVFFNIIDNAINYNREGGSVTIRLRHDAGGLAVDVADTGIGIPTESLDRIFERFYRVDTSRSRSTGGTGLGLSIVKHAADILEWRIRVASSREGTTFTVMMN